MNKKDKTAEDILKLDPEKLTEEEKKDVIKTMGEYLVDDEEFNALLREEFETVSKGFDGARESFMPQIHIQGMKGEDGKRKHTLIMIAGELNTENKPKMMMGMGAKFAEDGAHLPAIVFMSNEAWTSKPSTDEKNPLAPSKDPNREEAIVIAGMTFDGRVNMAVASIKRSKKNAIILTKEYYIDYEHDKNDMQNNLLAYFMQGYAMGMATGSKKMKEKN